MKLIKTILFGKAAKGESIVNEVTFKTTYPDTSISYNQWIRYIFNQLN